MSQRRAIQAHDLLAFKTAYEQRWIDEGRSVHYVRLRRQAAVDAEQLARATVIGSGELARQSPDPAATLRQNVTSPGGTTAAALDVLMDTNGMKDLMTRAIDAATRRSRELAG